MPFLQYPQTWPQMLFRARRFGGPCPASRGHTGHGGEHNMGDATRWEKKQNSIFFCELCRVKTLITATKGIGNTLLGVRSFLNFIFLRYINVHEGCPSHSPNSLFKGWEEFQFSTKVRTTLLCPDNPRAGNTPNALLTQTGVNKHFVLPSSHISPRNSPTLMPKDRRDPQTPARESSAVQLHFSSF